MKINQSTGYSSCKSPRRGVQALLLALCANSPAMAVKVTVPLPGGVDSYAECVLDQVGPKTGAVETRSIASNCRADFPAPSKAGLFGPRSVESCFEKYGGQASHRQASRAIYDACQDYFRRNTASNTALRGSRLR